METVKGSFGIHGGQLFAILNVLQLVGWTAIMIYDGALAANGIFSTGHWVWCLVIGALIIVWILYRHHESWQGQHHRHGGPFHPDADFEQDHFLQWQSHGRHR